MVRLERFFLMSENKDASELDSPYRLLKVMSLLQQREQPKPLTVSGVFDHIIELSRKGFALYGFKAGRWASGNTEYNLSSDGFLSDLGLLETISYIQIDKQRETIQLLRDGETASDKVKLGQPIESVLNPKT